MVFHKATKYSPLLYARSLVTSLALPLPEDLAVGSTALALPVGSTSLALPLPEALAVGSTALALPLTETWSVGSAAFRVLFSGGLAGGLRGLFAVGGGHLWLIGRCQL